MESKGEFAGVVEALNELPIEHTDWETLALICPAQLTRFDDDKGRTDEDE